ncbi:MAG: DNA-binding protein [Myxococcales bacterium SG8_38]|nr:MAG: DNA-binding protein [Myxococcales bacterium SG8_38]
MAGSKIAIIGSGDVGRALADGFLEHGYEVMRASRDPSKLDDWKAGAGDRASTGSFDEAAEWGDIVVLAVKGTAAESAVELCDVENLAVKTVIDATNPIANEPPQHGVLNFFTSFDDSLMERLQRKAPEARFVKAFSCVGNALMVDPDFGGIKPTMFICGNDDAAKTEVTSILGEFGWETEDMGTVEAARAIEPLCILWCIPGFARNQWSHAFKLLKP